MRKHKYSRIDRSTGQNKRNKVTVRGTYGGPKRWNGKIVRGGRVAWRRAKKTRRA